MRKSSCFVFGLILSASVLILSSCSNLKEEQAENEKRAAEQKAMRDAWFKEAENKAAAKHLTKSDEMVMAQFKEHEKREGAKNPFPIYDPPKEMTFQSGALPGDTLKQTSRIKTELNFRATPLPDVIEVFAGLLRFNYVLDPGLNGNVTLSMSEHLSQEELWDVLRQILKASNAYVDYSEKLVKIKPLDGIQGNDFSAKNHEVELAVFRLKNIQAKETAAQITPFLSRGNKPVEVEKQNMIIVLDTAEVVAKVKILIGEIDQAQKKYWYKMVVPCRYISPEWAARELSELLPVLGFQVQLDLEKPQPGAIHLKSLERMQMLVASAANKEALDEMARWMLILDQPEISEQEKIYIYDIINGKADELVKALSVMFPLEGTTMSAGKEGASGSDESLASKNKTTAGGNSISSSGAGKKSVNAPTSVFDTPVRVFADAVHNRLVIKTTPRAYAMIKALLSRLDTIPSQVLLQVLVVEVTLNDTVKFGVEFMMQGQQGNIEELGGTDYKSLAPGGDEQYGGKFWMFNPDNPNEKYGYVNALATQTNVKVISSPQVLVVSHNEAEISVGSKVPIVNSEITNTQSTVTNNKDSSTNLVRNIQYQDTGIILKITPHVTLGDRIAINMDQTVSEALENKTSKIDSPEIQERILKTVMSIKNGQTIICGGMIKEKVTDNLDSIPFVNKIPLLSRLVGDTDISTHRTEMMILITGTIISEDTKLGELLKRYRQSVDTLIEFENGSMTQKNKETENK